MGTKNRIFLGTISDIINHNLRNTFNKKVYMTDATVRKIEIKHKPLDKEYIVNHNFQIIIDNTIMIYFDENKKIYNCLSKVDNNFLIYGLKSKSNRTEVSTLFRTKPNQIKNRFIGKKNLITLKKDEFTIN